MSNFDSLLFGDSIAKKIINDSRQPNYLFLDAQFVDIGINRELTDYLFLTFDPQGNYKGDVAKLKDAVIQAAVKSRGDSMWQAMYGTKVPYEYPDSIQEHQYLNLIERLYLTSPGGYKRTPLFGQEMISREARMQIINQHIAGWGLIPTGLGLSYWIYRRRQSAGSANRLR